MKFSYKDRYRHMMFRNKDFIHPAEVSLREDDFSVEYGRHYNKGVFGVSKKEWRCSGKGNKVYKEYIGGK